VETTLRATADVTLAYLAGFFDGEGNIRIAKNSKNAKGYYLRISATQVNPAPLLLLQKQFGGYVYKRKPLQHSDGCFRPVPTSDWVLAGPRACLALQALIPYFVVKLEAARLGVRFQAAIRPRKGRRTRLTGAEQSERQFYVDALAVRTNHQRVGGVDVGR
jgi:LAGLIDADG DNA endonuclease family protein